MHVLLEGGLRLGVCSMLAINIATYAQSLFNKTFPCLCYPTVAALLLLATLTDCASSAALPQQQPAVLHRCNPPRQHSSLYEPQVRQ